MAKVELLNASGKISTIALQMVKVDHPEAANWASDLMNCSVDIDAAVKAYGFVFRKIYTQKQKTKAILSTLANSNPAARQACLRALAALGD